MSRSKSLQPPRPLTKSEPETYRCPFKRPLTSFAQGCPDPQRCVVCAPFHPVNVARHEAHLEALMAKWEARLRPRPLVVEFVSGLGLVTGRRKFWLGLDVNCRGGRGRRSLIPSREGGAQ